jgi:CBS domain-containing protein
MKSTLREIIQEKAGGQTMHSVPIDATIDEAVDKMNQELIGAVLVMRGGDLAGIFTERDVLTKVVGRQMDTGTTPVADVMTKDVLVCDGSTTLEDAMRIVTERRFRHLPVTEGNRLIGMVSSGDLTRWTVRDQQDTIEDLVKYISGDIG